jgi:hypothetical protein
LIESDLEIKDYLVSTPKGGCKCEKARNASVFFSVIADLAQVYVHITHKKKEN